MTRRRPFVVSAGSTTLARIPLLPAFDVGDRSCAVDPLLVEGMFLASRQTGAAAMSGHYDDQGRIAATVRAYGIRARFRPTPHGVFAGVATVLFADQTAELRLGGNHRARSSPSASWLATLSGHLLDLPEVLPMLTLTTSNLVTCRGQRLEHEQQATPGVAGPQRVTIRATDASVLILRVCKAGATYHEVVSEVARKWPAVPESVIRTTLLEMVRGGFLVTDLVPDSSNDDPLGHLLSKLPEACALREPLTRLRVHLLDADRHAPGVPDRLAALTAARTLCDKIVHHDRPLSVDVAADARIVLPAALAEEAAEAVGILWRVGRARGPLTGYHTRFLDRYGPYRFVPLLVGVGPRRPVNLSAGGFPRPALRTGRAAFTASGSPRVHATGVGVLGGLDHDVGIFVPR